MSKTSWIFAVITLACVSLEGSALACGTEFAPPPRPKPVQQVSFQQEANLLFTRANELDSAATTRERNAVAFDAEADALATRARRLRNQAQLVSFTTDRENLLEIADELTDRAQVSRSRATSERMRASEMRSEATNLRNRATQLVRFGSGNGGGGGGGWRGGPRKTASEGVTL
jgi:hypothetical protein